MAAEYSPSSKRVPVQILKFFKHCAFSCQTCHDLLTMLADEFSLVIVDERRSDGIGE
jgi:hypothetical protein